jgi:molybdopterin-binding protein
MNLLHLPEAARRLGISYPTLKQWIYKRKIRSVQTAGGHHRIPATELDRVLFGRKTRAPRSPAASASVSMTGLEGIISGRNQLVGRIVGLEVVGLLAKVTLDVEGQRITSIITRDACRALHLKVGETAAALIKATEVMIIRPPSREC